MIHPIGRKGLQHPQGFAYTVNANKNGKYTKGGYGLSKNGIALDSIGRNALKSR